MNKKEDDNDSFILSGDTLPILMNLAEGMPGGFFIYHADGNEELIYCNRGLLRIFGCETMGEFRELTGNTFRGIVYEEDYEQVEQSIWQQIEQSAHDLDYVEYRIRRKDGEIRWIQDYGHFYHTEDFGDVFYVFVDDATERMRKRITELEEMNFRLKTAYARESQYRKAILYDAVTFFEIDITKDTFLTPAMQVIEGQIVDLGEAMGLPDYNRYTEFLTYWAEHIEAGKRNEYLEFFRPERLAMCYISGELEQTFECWMTDIYGRKRLYKYVYLLGVNDGTGDVIALSVAKDVTDQLEHQRLFEMALSQANAANIAKQTFLSDMSHDVRTPLNSIIGFTELIQSHDYPKEKREEYMEKIRQSSEQLLKIVTESLEVTRMEAGKAVLTEVPCNILEIMTEAEDQLAPEFAMKGITVNDERREVTHANVIADRVRIREILDQLLDNALKYTPKGGHVTVSVEELPQRLEGRGTYLFTVQDDGIGIGEDFIGHIFEPFEREYNTTSSGVLGSGLGLAVVRNILDMMGGEISVESAVNEGSTFRVHLSLRLQDRQMIQTMPGATAVDLEKMKGKKILLVEDNEINMEIAQELLQECGFVVFCADNGQVALDMIRDNPPDAYDIVLMDIQMPVMNGYEATNAIRKLEDPVKSNIPIIAVSANAFAEDQEKSKQAGMNGHCPKPIDIFRLREMIARVLSSRIAD